MKKILIVDDEQEINDMVTNILTPHYLVTQAFSGTEALLDINDQEYDLILLDMMLPGKSGEDVLTEIREKSNVPVIMVTALSDSDQVVSLLDKGANDYITKPFNINILKARIAVQLRNSNSSDGTLKHKNMVLDVENHQILVNNQILDISQKEYMIMNTLLANPKKVFTKEALYNSVWDSPYYGDENTINVHISNLRRKIHDIDPETSYIKTIWGFGIQLDSDDV